MEHDKQLVVRLPADLMDKIDQHAKDLSPPGVNVSRAAAVRNILQEYFEKSTKKRRRRR